MTVEGVWLIRLQTAGHREALGYLEEDRNALP